MSKKFEKYKKKIGVDAERIAEAQKDFPFDYSIAEALMLSEGFMRKLNKLVGTEEEARLNAMCNVVLSYVIDNKLCPHCMLQHLASGFAAAETAGALAPRDQLDDEHKNHSGVVH